MIFICKLAVSLITPPGVFMLILFLLAILVICKSEHIVLGLALFLLSSIMYIISIPLVAFIFNNALNHIYSHQFPPKDANAAVIVLWCTAKLILYTKGVEMGQDIIVLGT